MRRTYDGGQRSRPDPTRTAVPLQYPFYVIRVNHFLELKVLCPHQELTAQGIVKEWDPSMKNVLFLSHQWTSWAHPDHTGEQLRTMQRLLTRMISGEVGTIEPTFIDKAYLPSGLQVTSEDWRDLLIEGDAFIWMECVAHAAFRPASWFTLSTQRSRIPSSHLACAACSVCRSRVPFGTNAASRCPLRNSSCSRLSAASRRTSSCRRTSLCSAQPWYTKTPASCATTAHGLTEDGAVWSRCRCCFRATARRRRSS
jgi:hypothetical protein